MTEESKAVVPSTPEDRAVADVRGKGAEVVAHRREMKELEKTIAGISFGSVAGSSFSPHMRWQIAKFCEYTGAEPLTQVDILGGKPYLNAAYWADNLVNQERFHHFEQRQIGEPAENAMRQKIEELESIADALEGQEKAKIRLRMFDLMEEADQMAHDRAFYQARATATSVVETTIWRFINQAPMEAIRAGKVTNIDQYLIPVKECNWAGGMSNETGTKKDPVGDANAGTTARSRSLRRCAAKAFSAWMAPYRERIEQAEKAIEAEYEVITEDNVAVADSLPTPGGPQAVSSSNGEPEAVNPSEAIDLPFEGEVVEPVPVPVAKKRKAAAKNAEPEAPSFDANDARKAYFATQRDAGIQAKDRKAWQEDNGFPESTGEWGKADYDRAKELLMAPTIARVNDGCEETGYDLGDLCLEVLGKDSPKFLKDWNALAARLQEELERGDL